MALYYGLSDCLKLKLESLCYTRDREVLGRSDEFAGMLSASTLLSPSLLYLQIPVADRRGEACSIDLEGKIEGNENSGSDLERGTSPTPRFQIEFGCSLLQRIYARRSNSRHIRCRERMPTAYRSQRAPDGFESFTLSPLVRNFAKFLALALFPHLR